MKNYNDELTEMLKDCSDWDSQSKALKEAFDRGISYGKKLKEETKVDKKFVVYLFNNQIQLFWNGEKFFDIEEAKNQVSFLERLYPKNKGLYKIYEIEEEQE